MFKYKFEIGDKVEIISSKNIGVIKMRKCEEVESEVHKNVQERYYISYGNSMNGWFLPSNLRLQDQMDYEYEVLSVLINVNLMSEIRNLEFVERLYNERKQLKNEL